MAERTRNYSAQRNYKYEAHDKDGNSNGLTEDDWKKQILDEWSCDKLKANHVTIIFHNKDKDENGILKELHAHSCINFADSLTQSEAKRRTGCSSAENCKPIGKLAQAYRYLLHITEQAIKEKKHIYSEDELIIDVAKGKKLDFHKMIQASEKEEEEKDDAKLLKKIIKSIQQGSYGEGSCSPLSGDGDIYHKVLLDENASRLMGAKPANRRAIENAIEIKEETYRAKQREARKKT